MIKIVFLYTGYMRLCLGFKQGVQLICEVPTVLFTIATKWVYKDTTQKWKFSIMDFFSKCDQIRRFLQCSESLEICI